jgi:UDP-xylose/UDP-N-acetylglucosamine transporter B4
MGVVLAAFSDAWSKQVNVEYHSADHERPSSSVPSVGISSQGPGFALLASALLLSACMGLYTDDMYATHGRSGSITAETLFYSHAISLPYFASQAKPLLQEFANVTTVAVSSFDSASTGFKAAPWPEADVENATSPASWTRLLLPFAPSMLSTPRYLPISMNVHIPRPVLLLLLNATTQLLCIVGVNRLSAQSSSLTVSIVLNIRKLASLMLSIWLFGNTLPTGVMLGAAVVFVGGGLYALPSSSPASNVAGGKADEKKKT